MSEKILKANLQKEGSKILDLILDLNKLLQVSIKKHIRSISQLLRQHVLNIIWERVQIPKSYLQPLKNLIDMCSINEM